LDFGVLELTVSYLIANKVCQASEDPPGRISFFRPKNYSFCTLIFSLSYLNPFHIRLSACFPKKTIILLQYGKTHKMNEYDTCWITVTESNRRLHHPEVLCRGRFSVPWTHTVQLACRKKAISCGATFSACIKLSK
jgi:hypothetical protein